MSHKKIDKELRVRQGKRLKELLTKEVYPGDPRFNQRFIEDINRYVGYNYGLSSQVLSQITSGQGNFEGYAPIFSKVLDVDINYLLDPDYPYKNDNDRKEQIIKEYEEKKASEMAKIWNQWNDDSNNRIQLVKTVIQALEVRNITVSYHIKESPIPVNKQNNHYIAYYADKKYEISEDDFSQWLTTSALNIHISENTWIHLCGVTIFFPDYSYIELNINDFMKLIYDINEEISHRLQTWLKYHSYTIKEAWEQSYCFYDIAPTLNGN